MAWKCCTLWLLMSEADLKLLVKYLLIRLLGRVYLGKSVGEVAEIQVPNGVMKFDIIEISR